MGQKGSLEAPVVVMGRIGAPFGVKGLVHIQSFTNPANNILSYKTWYFKLKGQWQKVTALQIKVQGSRFVGVIKGIDTREAAAKLTNAEIGVSRADLPPLEKDEYYWADLIGLTVVTERGAELGVVEGLLETGSNDVLVVTGEGQECLIPYLLGDTVLKVDLEARILTVLWDPEF